jgi:hypothetical protein
MYDIRAAERRVAPRRVLIGRIGFYSAGMKVRCQPAIVKGLLLVIFSGNRIRAVPKMAGILYFAFPGLFWDRQSPDWQFLIPGTANLQIGDSLSIHSANLPDTTPLYLDKCQCSLFY